MAFKDDVQMHDNASGTRARIACKRTKELTFVGVELCAGHLRSIVVTNVCRFSDLFHFELNYMLHFITLIISNTIYGSILSACVIDIIL